MKSLSLCVSLFILFLSQPHIYNFHLFCFPIFSFYLSPQLSEHFSVSHASIFSFLSKLPIYSQFIQFSHSPHCPSIDLCPKFFSSWEAIVHTGRALVSKSREVVGLNPAGFQYPSLYLHLSPRSGTGHLLLSFLSSFLLTSPSIQHLEISRRHIFCSSFLSISFFQRRSQERKTTRRRVSKIHCRTKKRLFLAWMVNPSFSFSTQVTHLFRFFFCTELFLWLLNEVWNVGKKKKVDSENIFYDHLSQIFGQRL